MVILGENKIKTLDDLGDLASDELLELLPEGILDVDAANELIMSARAHWFEASEENNETKPNPLSNSGSSQCKDLPLNGL